MSFASGFCLIGGLLLTICGFAEGATQMEHAVHSLAIFSYSDDDSQPTSLVKGPDGLIYAGAGGGNGTSTWTNGVILRFSPAGQPTELASFPLDGVNGSQPTVHIIDSDGSIYITTSGKERHDDQVLRLTTSGQLQSLFTFSGTNGFGVVKMLERDGRFYGITYGGGTAGYGTIFSLEKNGEHKVLHHFSGSDGVYPRRLVASSDGSLYGTTDDSTGFGNGLNVLFRCTPAGEFSLVASNRIDRFHIVGGKDSEIYGVDLDLSIGLISIFKISPSGTSTTLASLGAEMRQAVSGTVDLVEASDGNLVLLTEDGLLQLSKTGNLRTLTSFEELPGRGKEAAHLIEGAPNCFYFSRFSDRPLFAAGVFRVAPRPRVELKLSPDSRENVLSWNAFAGAEYSVEFADKIGSGWQIWPVVTASGVIASTAIRSSSDPALYFRVRLLP